MGVCVQEHGLHAGAYIAVFHTAVAQQCSAMAEEIRDDAKELPEHFDRCMHIMRTATLAVQELQSLHAPCSDLAAYLEKRLTSARHVLDKRMLNCQKRQVQDAMLPALSFASETGKLQAFRVHLQSQALWIPQHTGSLREKCIQALEGVPRPPALCESAPEWRIWLESMQCQSWSNTMLCLQQVEQYFFECAEAFLTNAPVPGATSADASSSSSMHVDGESSTQPPCLSASEVKECVKLLTLYSQAVAKVEAWPGVCNPRQPPDDDGDDEAPDEYYESPMLLVQLRGLEAILTWILMCLIHQQVATEEWPGLSRYRLPVEADELRHLCRGGNAAGQRAACVVAEYICRVAGDSSGRVCFSLASEDAVYCVVDFARTLLLLRDLDIAVAICLFTSKPGA